LSVESKDGASDRKNAPERHKEEQHSLLMHMPAEEEGRVARDGQRPDEDLVAWPEPELGGEDLPTAETSRVSRVRQWRTRADARSRLGVVRTTWSAIVKRKQCTGLTFGRTAKTVSPTKPLVELATPASSTASLKPSLGPTAVSR
jgi:hypothetical protein